MDALQMKYEFEIGYELANLSSRGYTEKEISTFLTQAQNIVALEIVGQEDSEVKDILIKNLKTNYESATVSASDIPNSVRIPIPPDLLKMLQERVDIEFNNTSPYYNVPNHTLTNVSVFAITEDYYNSNVENPDKAPYYKLVWRLSSESSVILIGDSTYTPKKYKCVYLHRPTPIIIASSDYTDADGYIDDEKWSEYTTNSLDCDLDESFHRKIVDRAIILAIEPTGNTQRLQSKVSIS